MRRAGWALLLVLLASVCWWLIGFLPWVTHGFAWNTVGSQELPRSAYGLGGVRIPLPLLADQLHMLLSGALLGGLLAGLTPITYVRHRPLTIPAVWLAVAATLALTSWLTWQKIANTAPDEFPAQRQVLWPLVMLLVLATVVGLLAGTASVWRHGFTALAAGLAVIAVPLWAEAFVAISQPDAKSTTEAVAGSHLGSTGQLLVNLATLVILVVGLMVSIRRTCWAALGWPLAAFLAWVAPAVERAVRFVDFRIDQGKPVSALRLTELAWGEFRDAVGNNDPVWWPILAAVAVAAVWLAKQILTRNRSATPIDG